jgi:predicted RNA-binding protein YlxR (DUF448 family)
VIGASVQVPEGALSSKYRKHVPLRTCITCRQRRPKRALIRIVRTPEGGLKPDPRGKEPGRGAYVCPDRDCWQAALERGRLQQALKCDVSADDLQALRAFAASKLTQDAAIHDR